MLFIIVRLLNWVVAFYFSCGRISSAAVAAGCRYHAWRDDVFIFIGFRLCVVSMKEGWPIGHPLIFCLPLLGR